MSEKNKKSQELYSNSMRSSVSQRSNTPNTTKPVKNKPSFTPPPQNVKKSSES